MLASMILSSKQLGVNRELAVREDMVLGVRLGDVDLEAEWTVVRQSCWCPPALPKCPRNS